MKLCGNLYHVDISRRYFFVSQLKIMFYFLHELNKGVTSLDGVNGRSIPTLLRETTRSNRLKFRLQYFVHSVNDFLRTSLNFYHFKQSKKRTLWNLHDFVIRCRMSDIHKSEFMCFNTHQAFFWFWINLRSTETYKLCKSDRNLTYLWLNSETVSLPLCQNISPLYKENRLYGSYLSS